MLKSQIWHQFRLLKESLKTCWGVFLIESLEDVREYVTNSVKTRDAVKS